MGNDKQPSRQQLESAVSTLQTTPVNPGTDSIRFEAIQTLLQADPNTSDVRGVLSNLRESMGQPATHRSER